MNWSHSNLVWWYNLTLQCDSSLCDLDLDSRPKGAWKQKTTVPIISQHSQLIWMACGRLLRLVGLLNFICIWSLVHNILGWFHVEAWKLVGIHTSSKRFSAVDGGHHCTCQVETSLKNMAFSQGHSCLRKLNGFDSFVCKFHKPSGWNVFCHKLFWVRCHWILLAWLIIKGENRS